MTNFDYKTYSIDKLRNWISDVLSSGEASAKEVYDAILSEVDDHTNAFKKVYENGVELQQLLRGHRPVNFSDRTWTSLVEEDSITGEQLITFPPDLLETLGWKEVDVIDWKNNYDGTFTLRKV